MNIDRSGERALACVGVIAHWAACLALRHLERWPVRISQRQPDREDYEVRSGELSLGRIYDDISTTQPSQRWYWSIYGVQAGPGIMALQGRAASLDEAGH